MGGAGGQDAGERGDKGGATPGTGAERSAGGGTRPLETTARHARRHPSSEDRTARCGGGGCRPAYTPSRTRPTSATRRPRRNSRATHPNSPGKGQDRGRAERVPAAARSWHSACHPAATCDHPVSCSAGMNASTTPEPAVSLANANLTASGQPPPLGDPPSGPSTAAMLSATLHCRLPTGTPNDSARSTAASFPSHSATQDEPDAQARPPEAEASTPPPATTRAPQPTAPGWQEPSEMSRTSPPA